ncbi:class I SAM-dependent methyltransferase [candidate division WOR-3 bacterium]|nr:class I SAM-dependent methyltransferase [candidate division WOR-3 bacterium]
MSIYDNFAYFYAKGTYPQFSEGIVELLPAVLLAFEAEPRTILDLACGEGTFAVAMAKKGFQVMGIDQSPQMLQFARERAEQEGVTMDFLLQDIRAIQFEEEFDLVTCWYDSLNYLLKSEDLGRTFTGVWQALKKEGFFIFDMNTIHGLAVDWQARPCYIQQDTPELFEIHRPDYNFEKNIATLRITGFLKGEDGWRT